MGMEALQQSIIQRPNLIMGGIDAARNEANARRLFQMQREGNIVQGILQALGLWTDQQRFGANMDETQRQFNVQEGVEEAPVQGMHRGMPVMGEAPPTYRAQANDRANEQFGWQREDRPMDREMQRVGLDAAILGLQGEKDQQGWFRGTRGAETDALNLRNQGMRQGLDQNAQMFPGQLEAQQQGLDRGGLEMQGEQQRQDAMKGQQEWLKRFQSAPSDAERFQIIGEDPDAWLRMYISGEELAGRQALAGAKSVGPQDYALEELRKRQGTFDKIGVTGADGFALLEQPAAQRARDAEAEVMGLMDMIRTGQVQPTQGESPEAFLGRVLSMMGQGSMPQTGASQVPARAGEDFSVPPR